MHPQELKTVLQQLADACPNLVGFKDGFGDIEAMIVIRRKLGERFACLVGLPAAEVFAGTCKAMGVPVYCSAVFNFIPRTAMAFCNAHAANDSVTTDRLITDFFLPYLDIRNRCAGYAVSIVKAGATIFDRGAGPVLPPLSYLKAPKSRCCAH
jgi:5-dehydro-4-deoxyglucarate dehydratase